ncbi:macrophage migration inhibitory factor homolog isoform X2 [Eriocheir sinensis]|uniref:L-dopachrome isomerase n=2 Tax=Eriocheir sinensis TaxID=95602 RepID=E7CW70_ERISI|nr:macrophage migration inhibitory factor homolog isoform X2 [Eriocheir sinensis]XP_050712466.1 macrophage migration inhibitory factor homolog isoform X2 [Eriocheir sinensis]XP_050712467.1 macrophage migration inhibitory factor homolog isoform X2 [Eriocheir sinensis]ADM86239.1 macrophage migration inhibitory protein [Eriocheir sinensis]
MPVLEVFTNVPKEKVTPEVLTGLSKLLSEMLGKSEQYCMVRIIPDQLMSFGGTTEPCGAVRLASIGKLGVEENKSHAAKLYAHLEQTLGIPSDRMYINFHDLETSNVGYKGTTFHAILGR